MRNLCFRNISNPENNEQTAVRLTEKFLGFSVITNKVWIGSKRSQTTRSKDFFVSKSALSAVYLDFVLWEKWIWSVFYGDTNTLDTRRPSHAANMRHSCEDESNQIVLLWRWWASPGCNAVMPPPFQLNISTTTVPRGPLCQALCTTRANCGTDARFVAVTRGAVLSSVPASISVPILCGVTLPRWLAVITPQFATLAHVESNHVLQLSMSSQKSPVCSYL